MRLIQDGERFLVRFEVGEKLPDALTNLAGERAWKSASLTGIGAVKDVLLGAYELADKRYSKFPVDGVVELVSLVGNLSWLNEQPMWHLHALVSDAKGVVTGGHLFNLSVAVTVECWIHVSKLPIERKSDPYTGLNLLDL